MKRLITITSSLVCAAAIGAALLSIAASDNCPNTSATSSTTASCSATNNNSSCSYIEDGANDFCESWPNSQSQCKADGNTNRVWRAVNYGYCDGGGCTTTNQVTNTINAPEMDNYGCNN